MSEAQKIFDPGTTLLIVDDDAAFRQALTRSFEAEGFAVRSADSFDAAITLIENEHPELAIVDMRLSEARPLGGIDLVRALQRADPQTRVVVLTGYGSIATTVAAMRAGAVSYVQKPATVTRLLAALAGADDASDARIVSSLGKLEWDHLQQVLTDSGGNVSEAARRLGMHRRSLQRKLARGAKNSV